MALKNRVAVATYEYDGDEIQLQANFAALERLSEATGQDAIVYIQSVTTIRDIVEIFYFLQFGTTHSREEIHNCFFAEIAELEKVEVQEKLGKAIAIMLGAKKNEVLEALTPADVSQKK